MCPGGCWAWVLFRIRVGVSGLGSAHLNTEGTIHWVVGDGRFPGLEPEVSRNAGSISIKIPAENVKKVAKGMGLFYRMRGRVKGTDKGH